MNNNVTKNDKPCLLCGSENLRKMHHDLRAAEDGLLFDILECVSCQLASIAPMLPVDSLASYYPDNYYSYQEMEENARLLSYVTENPIGIYEKISRYIRTKTYQFHYLPLPPDQLPFKQRIWVNMVALVGGFRFGFPLPPQSGGRILDVGCGDGFFLNAIKNRGWEVHGLEIAEGAVKRARNKGLQNVIKGTLDNTTYPENNFDIVRLWSVLEHLHDPVKTLKIAHRILKPGGILILQVPNYKGAVPRWAGNKWSAWDVPRHLYHFSHKSMGILLEKTEYQETHCVTCSVGTLPPSITHSPGIFLRIIGVIIDKFLDWFKQGDHLIVFATPLKKEK
jgi:2-polyprenyl-3-methyl-5-hydroxy-6-metoxy-1,4-benzoquinol methylase